MDTGLQDKIVLVTGAAKGIGRATALAFAREGAQLALLDIDADGLAEVKSEAEAIGVGVAAAATDLSTGYGVSKGIDALLQVLVANSIFWSTMSGRAPSGPSTN
jgi:NAD(P)-dependent dehydrogenase (short-subunit alcohol dehydrogenase family)